MCVSGWGTCQFLDLKLWWKWCTCYICESESWEMLSSTLPTIWSIGGDYVSLTKEGGPFCYRVFLDLPKWTSCSIFSDKQKSCGMYSNNEE
jgi:hypothetical protein